MGLWRLTEHNPWHLNIYLLLHVFGSLALNGFVARNRSLAAQTNWSLAECPQVCLRNPDLVFMPCAAWSHGREIRHVDHTRREGGGNRVCTHILTHWHTYVDKTRVNFQLYVWGTDYRKPIVPVTRPLTLYKHDLKNQQPSGSHKSHWQLLKRIAEINAYIKGVFQLNLLFL